MKEQTARQPESRQDGQGQDLGRELARANARYRHFRGIAAGVMVEALALWREIWDALQDPRSCEEILDGAPLPASGVTLEELRPVLEKLHVLGVKIDYARRLCEGAIGREPKHEGEV